MVLADGPQEWMRNPGLTSEHELGESEHSIEFSIV
jgi:hypothetical protein